MQFAFGLNVGRVGTSPLFFKVKPGDAYKPGLIAIKKFFRFPERLPDALAVTDEALRPLQLCYNVRSRFRIARLCFDIDHPPLGIFVGYNHEIGPLALAVCGTKNGRGDFKILCPNNDRLTR